MEISELEYIENTDTKTFPELFGLIFDNLNDKFVETTVVFSEDKTKRIITCSTKYIGSRDYIEIIIPIEKRLINCSLDFIISCNIQNRKNFNKHEKLSFHELNHLLETTD